MKTFFWILTTLIISSTWTPLRAEEHPDLAKLKLYRSYYHIQLEGKSAHQFEVWYQYQGKGRFPEWQVFQAALQDTDDASKISKEDYLSTYRAVAGWPKPPKKLKPVPEKLNHLAKGLKEAVKKNHPELDIKDIKIQYHGHAARLFVYELVPISVKTELNKRLAQKAARFYFADLKAGKLDSVWAGSRGIGGVTLDEYLGPQVENPNWVDFSLPKKIEGSSILYVDHYLQSQPIYQKAQKDLLKAVVETAKKIDQDAPYDPSLDKILKRQGKTLLPVGLKQLVTYDVQIYGRTQNFKEQLNHTVKLLFHPKNGPIKLTKVDQTTGIKLTLEGDLSRNNPVFKVTAEDKDGNIQSKEVESETEKVEFIEDGNRLIINSSVYTKYSYDPITLPGQGKYQKFDVYTDGYFAPFPLTNFNQ